MEEIGAAWRRNDKPAVDAVGQDIVRRNRADDLRIARGTRASDIRPMEQMVASMGDKYVRDGDLWMDRAEWARDPNEVAPRTILAFTVPSGSGERVAILAADGEIVVVPIEEALRRIQRPEE